MKQFKNAIAALLIFMLSINLSGCYMPSRVALLRAISLLQNTDSFTVEYEVGENIVKDRPNFEKGINRRLYDDIEIQLFFMDDDESQWSTEEVNAFLTNQLLPALDFLKEQAKRYDVTLNFNHITYANTLSKHYSMIYDGKVNSNLYSEGSTKDTLDQAARQLGYEHKEEMHDWAPDGKEIIYLTVFNKAGICYTRNQLGEANVSDTYKYIEHCVLFSEYFYTDLKDNPTSPSTIAFQLLLLYGAENLNKNYQREYIAKDYYPNDIMLQKGGEDLQTKEVDEYTAFAVGWLFSAPEVCYIEQFWETKNK